MNRSHACAMAELHNAWSQKWKPSQYKGYDIPLTGDNNMSEFHKCASKGYQSYCNTPNAYGSLEIEAFDHVVSESMRTSTYSMRPVIKTKMV